MSDDTAHTHPRFSDAELARRHAAVRGILAEEGLDALLVYGTASGFSEVQYLSDFRTVREAYLVLPAEGEPTLLVQYFNHVPYARRRARVADVRWAGPQDLSTLVAHLAERGLGERRIGLVGGLPWQQYAALRASLPRALLSDVTATFQRLRLVKSEEELAFLRRGAALSDLAMEALEREVRPGIAEYELAAIVEGAYLPLGGHTHIHYMGTTPMRDPSLCVPAQIQSDRVLQAGDVLITEISAQYDGYPGQILRSFSIGEPPTAEYQRMHDLAVRVFERIAGVVRPGATVEEVLDAADEIHEAGYTICDDLLHGFGGGYFVPHVRTKQTGGTRNPGFVFAENMTFVIQPNVITPDERMGVQVGELLRVTRTGVESLHQYPMRFTRCG
ncbi:MAG TPA: Xaa-Pro peptidase family protein [Ktedonobacterales bacterium]|nr:Xaa-Pro peptidase family protein [Ktedonobacterales bacterium]